MLPKMSSARWISASLLVILLTLQPIADAFYLPGTFMHTYSVFIDSNCCLNEKAPYVAKAEYTKKIDAYNNPQAGEASGDSDKSKSEVNDEDDGSEGD